MRVLSLFLAFLVVRGDDNSTQDLAKTCGDCWCIPDPECRAEQAGFADNLPESVSQLYASFVEKADTSILLQTADRNDCYPFADAVQNIFPDSPYAEASLPQCQKPNSTDGYCAFVFDDSNANFTDTAQCEGRTYSLETFATEDDVPANAAITHKGPCGVCSSAKDWSRRIVLRDDMADIGQLCGTKYYLSSEKSFDVLIQCYMDEGFTEECSKLWGHFTATNGMFCAGPCIGNEPPYNGDAPQCAINECLACGEQFRPDFDLIAGRSMKGSGMTEPIARNCSEFYPVIHDPCPGASSNTSTFTPIPQPNGASRPWGILSACAALVLMIMW